MPLAALRAHPEATAAPQAEGPLRVTRVELRRRADRRRFMAVPPALYAADPRFVPPLRRDSHFFLDPDRNPALEDIELIALIAERRGRPVGRVTVQIDRAFDRAQGKGAAWFGFFEAEDAAAAEALFAAAGGWLREQGALELFGPVSFSLDHVAGTLVSGFDRPPVFGTAYNPPTHGPLLEGLGFQPARELVGWRWDLRQGLADPRLLQVLSQAERLVERDGFTVRSACGRRREDDLVHWHALLNASRADQWGHSPLSHRSLAAFAYDLGRVAIDDLLLFVEHEGRPVGCAISLPDVTPLLPRDGRLLPTAWLRLLVGCPHSTTLRLQNIAVLPDYRMRSLELLLLAETARRALARGVRVIDVSWTGEEAHALHHALRRVGARRDRSWNLYRMDLQAGDGARLTGGLPGAKLP